MAISCCSVCATICGPPHTIALRPYSACRAATVPTLPRVPGRTGRPRRPPCTRTTAAAGQLAQPRAVVQVPRHPYAVQQVDPRGDVRPLPLLVDLLDHGAERREAGAAGDHQQVARVVGRPRQPLAHGRPQLHGVPDLQGPHHGRAHLAAVDLLDVQVDRPVVARGVGRAEVAPLPGTLRDLHRHRLAGAERERRAGAGPSAA